MQPIIADGRKIWNFLPSRKILYSMTVVNLSSWLETHFFPMYEQTDASDIPWLLIPHNRRMR